MHLVIFNLLEKAKTTHNMIIDLLVLMLSDIQCRLCTVRPGFSLCFSVCLPSSVYLFLSSYFCLCQLSVSAAIGLYACPLVCMSACLSHFLHLSLTDVVVSFWIWPCPVLSVTSSKQKSLCICACVYTWVVRMHVCFNLCNRYWTRMLVVLAGWSWDVFVRKNPVTRRYNQKRSI